MKELRESGISITRNKVGGENSFMQLLHKSAGVEDNASAGGGICPRGVCPRGVCPESIRFHPLCIPSIVSSFFYPSSLRIRVC